MKPGKKILLLTLLIAGLVIIFFPVNKKADLSGHWSIDTIIIDGKKKPFEGRCQFYADKLDIYGEGDFFVTNMIEEATVSITKDSLKIISEKENSFFTGKYKISLSKKLQGKGDKTVYLIELKLGSKNKSITMYRNEKVAWWYTDLPKDRRF